MRKLLQTLIIGAILIAPIVSFPAIHFEAAWTNAPVNSTFSPLDGSRYRFVMPDGTFEDFAYNPLAMFPFSGRGNWAGEWSDERRDYVRLFRLGAKGRPMPDGQEILFKGGRLLYARVGTAKKPFCLIFSSVTDNEKPPPLETLWKVPDQLRNREQEKASDLWNGSGRLRLWYVNPNLAAIPILQLLLIALAGGLFARKWPLRVGAGVLSPLLLAGLLKTSSRGAFVAFVAGLFVLLSFWFFQLARVQRLKWNRRTLGLVCCGVIGLAVVGYIVTHISGGRFGIGLWQQDASTDRMALWSAVPRMILDAPGGWGLGNAGNAYLSWYADLARTHYVRTLVSSHLTWMVEFGSVGRFLYLFGWSLAFVMTFRSAWRGKSPLPLALVLSFFIACLFNPVGEGWELWLAPVIATGFVLVQTFRQERSSLWASMGVALALVLAVLCVLLGLVPERQPHELVLRQDAGAVRIKGEVPALWIVDDREYGCALSSYTLTGREIRGQYGVEPDLPALGYVAGLDALPPDARHVVVGGLSCADYLARWKAGSLTVKPETLQFISPPFPPSAVPEELVGSCGFRMIVGSLAAQHWPKGTRCPAWTVVIPGARLYIPAWLDYALGRQDVDDDRVKPNLLNGAED